MDLNEIAQILYGIELVAYDYKDLELSNIFGDFREQIEQLIDERKKENEEN